MNQHDRRNEHVEPAPGTMRDREAVAFRQGGTAVFDVAEEPNRLRLWDCITETWSQPFERGAALGHYLRKVVFRCSACRETNPYEEGIRSHVGAVERKHAEHRTARMEQVGASDGQILLRCTGCDAPLTNRKQQGQKHLDSIASAYEAHRSAGIVDVVLMQQYSLSPSAAGPEQVVDTIHLNGTVPELDGEDRSGAKRPRRRNRRRRRR